MQRLLLLAACTSAASSTVPSQRWVNFGGNESEVVFTWTSNATSDQRVHWGAAAGGPYAVSAAPDVSVYASPPIAGVQATTYTSSLIHRVAVALNTTRGARIYYRIGSDADGFSEETSFLSHPGVGADVAVNVMVLADMDVQCFDGKNCNPQSVLRALTTSDLIASANGGALFCGDLSYASGNQSHWDAWQEFFDPVSSQMVVMANAGNHEGDEHGFIPFKTRFGGMPFASPLSDDSGPMWYSYNVGGVHVVVVSAYADFDPRAPMVTWLTDDLTAVNRSLTPWVIAVWHPPWYNSNAKHYLEAEDMRVALEPLLLAQRVNAIYVGHVHAFQRTHYVANNTVVDPAAEAGMYHFMVGTSGKELYQQWQEPAFPWVATRNATFWGPAFFYAPNATHARFRIHCAAGDTYACDVAEPVDEFWFTNTAL